MRQQMSRGRGNSRPRFRSNDSGPPRKQFKPQSNGRNIARAQEYHGRYSGPVPEVKESKWDVAPELLRGFSAQQVKLVGVFTPGKPIPQAEIVRVAEKLRVQALDPEHSALNRSLIIKGDYEEYCKRLFKSIGLGTASKQLGGAGGALIQFETPKHVAVLLASPGDLELKRPPGLVTSDCESIWSNQNTVICDDASEADESLFVGEEQVGHFKKMPPSTSAKSSFAPLYPQINPAPVSCLVETFDTVPPCISRTLVILNGNETEEMKKLLNGATEIRFVHQRVLKVFARFESLDLATQVGTRLHLSQLGSRKLLCGYWNDEAFDLGIY